jgi:hypothetical protein
MSKEQAAEAVETLGYISKKLREAISATLPCAQEQYLTISIPGLVIDTRDDGKGEWVTFSSSYYLIVGVEIADD